jgi:uncharacterized membrane protein YhaH (DUF805 family)
MSMSELLFSFRGRLNRKPYWLATLAIIVVMGVIATVLISALGFSVEALLGGAVVYLILLVPLIWIGLALGAKRLHDRDKSAWWLLVFYLAPAVLQNVADQAGGAGWLLSLLAFAINIWMIVELGFLRGTVGPNRYGPDPLAQAVPTTMSAGPAAR